MDIYPLGHASFRLKGKQTSLVTDPFDPAMVGLKFGKVEAPDIITISHRHPDHDFVAAFELKSIATAAGERPFVICAPGEYEVGGVTILGISTFHDANGGARRGKNIVFKISFDGLHLCHLGDLGEKLTDEQLDLLGEVDVLFIPVGGHFTIDARVAAEVVAQVEPTVVVPMHYKRPGMAAGFDLLDGVERFISEMGAESAVPQPKLSVSKDKLPETTTVVVLE